MTTAANKPAPEKPAGVVRSALSHVRKWKITPRQWRLGIVAIIVFVALALVYRQIDMPYWHARAAEVQGWLVFSLVTILPLLGFPVSVLHAIAGVRFGLGLGFVIVAASIFLQLLGAHFIVKLAPGFFARKLSALRRRLPNAAHRPLTIFTMLLPGAPYTAQIYVLPLMGVPLRTYLAWSLPINVIRCIVGVAAGEFSDRYNVWIICCFVAYGIAIMVLSAWSFQRLRQSLASSPPGAAGDPKPPGLHESTAP